MPKRVLIVDDEKNIVIPLEFLLEQAGYRHKVARDGAEAMDLIDKFSPNLVLLDVMMPRINGFEVCRRIRENSQWANIKIIMLTAKGQEAEMKKGLALGANAYISKPFSTKLLMQKIDDCLKDDGKTKI